MNTQKRMALMSAATLLAGLAVPLEPPPYFERVKPEKPNQPDKRAKIKAARKQKAKQ